MIQISTTVNQIDWRSLKCTHTLKNPISIIHFIPYCVSLELMD